MKEALSPAEQRVLAQLGGHSTPVPEGRFEAEALDALERRGMVRRLGGFVLISTSGRTALLKAGGHASSGPAATARPHTAPPRPVFPEIPAAPREEAPAPAASGNGNGDGGAETPAAKVNSAQEDLLRRLVLEGNAVPVDDLDGRTIRALEGRGLVRRASGQVEATEEGRAYYERHVRRRRRVRNGLSTAAAATVPTTDEDDERTVRAKLLRNAVEALRRVIGEDEEVEVGDLVARAGDAFAAMLELADRIERGDDPRRIPRGPRK